MCTHALEYDIRALKVVGKSKGGRGNTGGVRAYAEKIGMDHFDVVKMPPLLAKLTEKLNLPARRRSAPAMLPDQYQLGWDC